MRDCENKLEKEKSDALGRQVLVSALGIGATILSCGFATPVVVVAGASSGFIIQ